MHGFFNFLPIQIYRDHLDKLAIPVYPFDKKPHVKSGENCLMGFREDI